MDYQDALNFIHSEKWLGPKRSLLYTRDLLTELGSPDSKFKIIHVAGTNGKGSTCAFIESILRQAGYKTGLFTSPYISRFNERIRINGKSIGDQELVSLVEELEPYLINCKEHPKEFEIVTVLGLMYFAEQKCDVAVIEVGMGGLNDYTNVIEKPDAVVITSIGIDHAKQLGSTIPEIAKAKAGIIKNGSDVVVYGGNPNAIKVFEDVCFEKEANLLITDMSKVEILDSDLVFCSFSFNQYRNIKIPLAGIYQPYNAALAINVAELLRSKGYHISDDNIKSGIESVNLDGRFELLRKNPCFILDCAHNPHAVNATVESLVKNFGNKKIIFITGVMADKDIKNMINELIPISRCFITIPIDYPRALSAESYAELIRSLGAEAYESNTIEEGVKMAVNMAGENGIVCATGSVYLIDSVRKAVMEMV